MTAYQAPRTILLFLAISLYPQIMLAILTGSEVGGMLQRHKPGFLLLYRSEKEEVHILQVVGFGRILGITVSIITARVTGTVPTRMHLSPRIVAFLRLVPRIETFIRHECLSNLVCCYHYRIYQSSSMKSIWSETHAVG